MSAHTAYELIPESGKVVVLDIDLPIRQALHALHEQGLASAPLWDSREAAIIGVISASDFIHILKRCASLAQRGALQGKRKLTHTPGGGRRGRHGLCGFYEWPW